MCIVCTLALGHIGSARTRELSASDCPLLSPSVLSLLVSDPCARLHFSRSGRVSSSSESIVSRSRTAHQFPEVFVLTQAVPVPCPRPLSSHFHKRRPRLQPIVKRSDLTGCATRAPHCLCYISSTSDRDLPASGLETLVKRSVCIVLLFTFGVFSFKNFGFFHSKIQLSAPFFFHYATPASTRCM